MKYNPVLFCQNRQLFPKKFFCNVFHNIGPLRLSFLVSPIDAEMFIYALNTASKSIQN